MKTLKLLLCFSLFTFHYSLSFAQSWDWGRQGVGVLKTINYGSPVATDKHGNAYLTGQYETSCIFGNDTLAGTGSSAFLVKYNSTGNAIWAKMVLDTAGISYGNSVAVDKSGNIYITGCFTDDAWFDTAELRSPQAHYATFLVKYDTNGNVIWARQSIFHTRNIFNKGGAAKGGWVTTDKLGNAYITGEFADTISFGGFTLKVFSRTSDIYIAKYDSNGNALWASQANVPHITDVGGKSFSIAADNFGNSYITGNFIDTLNFGATQLTDTTGQYAGFVAKYSPSGNVLWAQQDINKSASSSSQDYSVVIDENNDAYVTGSFEGIVNFNSHVLYSPSTTSAFLAKYDLNGNIIWIKRSTPGWEGTGLSMDEYNHIYMAGLASNNPDTLRFGNYYYLATDPAAIYVSYILKFDSSGGAICGSYIGNIGPRSHNGIASDPTGTYIYTASSFDNEVICGPDTLTNPGGGYDIFIGRWINCSEGSPQGVNELRTKSEELRVYPNPFSNTTTIVLNTQYSVPTTHYLELDDLTGRKLRQIEFTGTQYQLKANDLAKGIYFIRAFDSDMNVIGTSKIVVQ